MMETKYKRTETEKDRQINRIIDMEWQMFDVVENIGGRAHCQDDADTFYLMRWSQHQVFSTVFLNAYEKDCVQAMAEGRNLIEEKYAYMMEETDADYFNAHWRALLPQPSPVKKALIDALSHEMRQAAAAAAVRYPQLADRGRPEESQGTEVSSTGYLIGEMKTWSLSTLYAFQGDLKTLQERGINPVAAIYENMVTMHQNHFL